MKKNIIIALLYTIFSGMFVFPLPISYGDLRNQLMGIFVFVESHLFVAYVCATVFESNRAFMAFFLPSTSLGIIFRYILEYGETSWLRIFTAENVMTYMFASTILAFSMFVLFRELMKKPPDSRML